MGSFWGGNMAGEHSFKSGYIPLPLDILPRLPYNGLNL